jgi:hypothetical protein
MRAWSSGSASRPVAPGGRAAWGGQAAARQESPEFRQPQCLKDISYSLEQALSRLLCEYEGFSVASRIRVMLSRS